MRSFGISLALAAILVALGVYHGLATDRWANSWSENSGQSLPQLPMTLGEWSGETLPRLDDDDLKTVVENRRYRHRSSDAWILTSLTAGRSGRVSIHNPENCYLGNGYQVVDSIRVETVVYGGREARFWTGHFQKKKPTGMESIRIYWGWTEHTDWLAPEHPRLFFAGKPRLYKLYFIHPVDGMNSNQDTMYREFMVDFLTAWDRSLKSVVPSARRSDDFSPGRE
jgi:hypothetical protein